MIYTYICPLGHEVDARGGVDDVSRLCECGKMSQRKSVYLVSIVGETVAKEERGRVRDYVEASEEIDYHYTKAEQKGMNVKRPDLWSKAKKKAGIA